MISLYPVSNVSFGNIPLSKYKGPRLALTDAEKLQIDQLYKELAQHVVDRARLDSIYDGKHLGFSTFQYYQSELHRHDSRIEAIPKEIRAIKINRHNIQVQEENRMRAGLENTSGENPER